MGVFDLTPTLIFRLGAIVKIQPEPALDWWIQMYNRVLFTPQVQIVA